MKLRHRIKKGKWRTGSGEVIDIDKMSDDHLTNAIAYVERIFNPKTHAKYGELLAERQMRNFSRTVDRFIAQNAKTRRPDMCKPSGFAGNIDNDATTIIDLDRDPFYTYAPKFIQPSEDTFYVLRRREANHYFESDVRGMTNNLSRARQHKTIDDLLWAVEKGEYRAKGAGFDLTLGNYDIARITKTTKPASVKFDVTGAGFILQTTQQPKYWGKASSIADLPDATIFNSEAELLYELQRYVHKGPSTLTSNGKIVRVTSTPAEIVYKETIL